MPILQGATNFTANHSSFTDIQGNATFIQFGDGPPSESQIDMFKKLMTGLISTPEFPSKESKYALVQSVRDLPHAKAAYNDYSSEDRRRVACLQGTREALLTEIAGWVLAPDGSRIYVLAGLAGLGKSTIAYTVAKAMDTARLLGASFFFSRDEAERRTAKKFMTSIVFQLCVYDEEFASAIGQVLLTERGCAATSKHPEEQLKALILEPLQDLTRGRSQPVVIVIDALDECDDQDVHVILETLNQLVRALPCFKVFLTSRPQCHIHRLLEAPGAHQVFLLQNIEDKVVDDDIRLYLLYNLSEEQVAARLPSFKERWRASNADIDMLVRAACRLFIFASTAVLFILDRVACDPASQMERLRSELTLNRTPFPSLSDFYNVVLRSAVPLGCGFAIAERYQKVLGTILVIQNPLPIKALANLTGSLSETNILAVLSNLQPIFLLDGDIPLAYHQSFPNYVTDEERCKSSDLRIVTKDHHTRMAICCFRKMNGYLQKNILGLRDPACFMENDTALAVGGISRDQLHKKFPSELQYACIYFGNHLHEANCQDADLIKEICTFADQHLLHWFEALSWICRLDSALGSLRALLKLSVWMPLNTRTLFDDGQHFILRFYEIIERSALHTYYSALPFAPAGCLLHKQYFEDLTHNLCHIQFTARKIPDSPEPSYGWWWPTLGFKRSKAPEVNLESEPAKWDAMISTFLHPYDIVRIIFSPDSSQFASLAVQGSESEMKVCDATSGTHIRTYSGNIIAISDDFSIVAISENAPRTVTLYFVASNEPMISIQPPLHVVCLALSYDGSRLSSELSDGTICLWKTGGGELVASHADRDANEWSGQGRLEFSPSGHRFAFMSRKGFITLFDAANGRRIASTRDIPQQICYEFLFSRDSSGLVFRNETQFVAWNSGDGQPLAVVENIQFSQIFSADNRWFAIINDGKRKFEPRNTGSKLITIENHIGTHEYLPGFMKLSHNLRATVCCRSRTVKLYDFRKGEFEIATLPNEHVVSVVAISPDGARLASGNRWGIVHLWDVTTGTAEFTSDYRHPLRTVSASSFAPDCSRLAVAFSDGSLELWDTSGHTCKVVAACSDRWEAIKLMTFSTDGYQLAFYQRKGSKGVIRFWDGRGGELIGTLEPKDVHAISMALARGLLAVQDDYNVIRIWDCSFFYARKPIKTLEHDFSGSLLFSLSSSVLISIANSVRMWKATENGYTIQANGKPHFSAKVARALLSPDGSQLASQFDDGGFQLMDTTSMQPIQNTKREDVGWLSNWYYWNGFLPSLVYDKTHGWRILGRFSDDHDRVPLLWIPKDVGLRDSKIAYGSCMLSLDCGDGRVLLIRSSTVHEEYHPDQPWHLHSVLETNRFAKPKH